MKRLLGLIVIFCSVMSTSISGAGETGTEPLLSFTDTEELAFKNNKAYKIQELEVKAMRARITAAKSGYLPKLTATSGFTHNGSVLGTARAPGAKKDPGIYTGYEDDNKAGLELSENLYNGGATSADLAQAKLRLKIEEQTLRAMKLDTELECRRLYFGLLLAEETQRIARALHGQAQKHYEEVQKKFDQGTASKFDVLQSKVQASKLTPEVIRAENVRDLISAELKKFLGLSQEDNLSLKDKLEYRPIEIQESEFLKTAYLNRPEIILETLGVDLSQWSIKMAHASGRPQVNVSAGFNYRSNDVGDMFNQTHNNWNAGIAVSVPIFDGFSTKAKVDEAKVRYAQAILAKENLGDQTKVDIKRACLDLKKAQAIVDSQKDSIEEAKEALRLADVRFQYGEGTNLDVLDAQVSLSQMEKNLSEGIYEFVMAEAYLNRSMGKELVKAANF